MGIVEQRFDLFNWGEITDAEVTELAIPKHRIQHFKYDGIVVWDKSKQLDDVFGSTGSGRTIINVIEELTRKNKTSELPMVPAVGSQEGGEDFSETKERQSDL